MLGDNILVAPIFNDEGIAQYYLPEGRWTDYFTGEVKQGGRWIKEKHDYLSIPLMVREGSIIAIGACDDDAVYDYADKVIIKAYELQDGISSTAVVYNEYGEIEVNTEIIRNDKVISINVDSLKEYSVILINVTNVSSITNATLEIIDNNTIITPSGTGKITCTVTRRR